MLQGIKDYIIYHHEDAEGIRNAYGRAAKSKQGHVTKTEALRSGLSKYDRSLVKKVLPVEHDPGPFLFGHSPWHSRS